MASADPARQSWEQDLLSLTLDLSRRGRDVVPFELGGQALFFVNSAAGAHHVLVQQRHGYASVPFPLATIAASLTDSGAALLRLKPQKALRQSIRPLPGLLAGTAADLIGRIETQSASGVPFDVLPTFKAALLGTMTTALFGLTLDVATVENAAAAKSHMERYRACQLPPGTIARDSDEGRALQAAFETECAYSRQILQLTGLLGELEHVSRPASPPRRFDDELSRSATDQAIANVARLLMNSYNGPAIALAWLIWILAEHPAAQARVADEAAQASRPCELDLETAAALPYTRQVVQETLRLYPPAWVIARRALAADLIEATPIPAGASVIVSPFVLHRDPRYWTDPDKFVPDRFDSATSPAPRTGSYLPFGLGASTCPANAFALKELQFLLARLASRFRWHAVNSTVSPWGLISLHPAPGVFVQFSERKPL